MFFVGHALKCYRGDFLNNKGAKEVEPKLVDCGRNAVCASGYAKTNFISTNEHVVPAGSWAKFCIGKSNLPEVSEEFGDGVSDQCAEAKVKVHTLNKSFQISCLELFFFSHYFYNKVGSRKHRFQQLKFTVCF